MRRTLTLPAMLFVLALVAAACADRPDTGFPPPPEQPRTAGFDDHAPDEGDGPAEDDFEVEPQTQPETEVEIKALNIRFNRDLLLFVADAPISLTFENLDDGVRHNVAIYTDRTLAEPVFESELFNGVATRVYEIPPTPAGEYWFICDLHPNMNGEAIFE